MTWFKVTDKAETGVVRSIAMDQSRYVLTSLQKEVKNLDDYEPDDPAPYVNCRPWGAVVLLGGVYRGDDPRKKREQAETDQAMRYTLRLLAAEGTITLYRADGLIAGVWLGQPLGSYRVKIPDADRDVVRARDGYACVLCGATDDLTLDHIFPAVHGGSNDPINLRVLCRSCNSTKGATISDAIRLLGRG